MPTRAHAPPAGQGEPADGRTCRRCGGSLECGDWFVCPDYTQHREVECLACGHAGIETYRRPESDRDPERFGAVFQAGGRARAIAAAGGGPGGD